MTPGDLISQYLKMRGYLEGEEAKHSERMKPYHDGMLAIEGALLDHLNKNDLQNVKAKDVGTAFKTTLFHAKVADRQSFLSYVVENWENGTEAFLTNAVSKEAVKEHIEKYQTPPPGVDIAHTTKVNIRKA